MIAVTTIRPFAFGLAVAWLLTSAGVSGAAKPEGAAATDAAKVIPLQPGDDELLPLEPLQSRTKADIDRVDALAWYMTGRLKESRNDFRGALEAYRKAIELDADAVAVYRALVPLAFNLDQTEDAIKYAMKAVELDANEYQLLRRLSLQIATNGRDPLKAVQLLERASKSNSFDKQSSAYVSLMRDLALMYGMTGKPDESADCFEVVFQARLNPEKFKLDERMRELLDEDPKTSFEQIGQAFLTAKRPELAIEAFQKAAQERDGRPGTLNFNLAQVFQQTEQPAKALDELQKYFDAQLQSKGRAAYELLAEILKDLDRSDELVPRLEKLAKQDRRNSTLQYFLAEQYVANDQIDEAEELYRSTLKDTGDVAGYVGLAAVYRQQKKPDDLLDTLAKAAAGGGDLSRLSSELEAISKDEELSKLLLAAGRKRLKADPPQLNFAAGYLLAKLAAQATDTDAAVAFYRFAIDARRDRAGVLLEELGQHLLEVAKWAEAAKVFNEAAEDPSLSDQKASFLFRMSQALEMSGETDAALKALAEARELLPDNPLLHYQEGWVHYHSRKWEPAIRIFQEVIEKYPQAKDVVRRARFSLSNIYVQQGDIRKGEEVLEAVYAEEPDDPSVNNDLGYLYADQGKKLEQAEKMIRKALDAEPENPAYLDSMGWVLFKLGKIDEAVPFLEKATEKPGGDDPTILDHLADCYHAQGNTEKGRELWQKALDKAKAEPNPDKKLIEKIETKLKE